MSAIRHDNNEYLTNEAIRCETDKHFNAAAALSMRSICCSSTAAKLAHEDGDRHWYQASLLSQPRQGEPGCLVTHKITVATAGSVPRRDQKKTDRPG